MKAVLIFFLFMSPVAFGQQKIMNGNISDGTHPVPDALIQLFRSDSTLIKEEFTDAKGQFAFELSDQDTVFLMITADSFADNTSELIIAAELKEEYFIQLEKAGDLAEVVVTAKKPYLERKPGKLILNVEESVMSSGSSAFEVLEKAPAVNINSSDVITLSGKSGIVVQVNGKALPMSGTELANYLRGIPSSSIQKIELITNPSAMNDAAGNAIINIMLKKDTRMGTNGTVNLSAGHGVYHKLNGGFSINHRTGKVNIYGSYNYALRKSFNQLLLERRFFENGEFQGAYIQDNYITFPIRNHIARAGLDWQLTDKSTLSVIVSGVSNKFSPNGFNSSDVIGSDGNMQSRFETENESEDFWYNGTASLNFTRNIDTLGSVWSFDLDYARFGNQTDQLFTTRYLDLEGNEFQPAYLLKGDLSGKLAMYAAKTDYSKVFANSLNVKAGLKSSYVNANNNIRFFDSSSGVAVYDSTKSNHYVYDENINSAYASAGQSIGKWNYEIGLRMENTNISGVQIIYDQRNDTSYIQLFPTLFAGYKFSENHTLELSVNRRIDRPGYDQLNPFKFYLDPSTYKVGNPYLKPQSTYTVELGHLWKQRYYTQLGIARTYDNITEVIAPAADENVTVQTNINLQKVDLVYGNISAPIEIAKWWNSTFNLNGYVALYSGDAANTRISARGNLAWNITDNNTFLIGKTWVLEFNGSYRSSEIYAFDKIKPIWTVGLGAQKKILENRGTLRVNVTDIFHTNGIRADVAFTDYTEYFDVKRETRVATLAFTYRFGKASIPASKRRGTGVDDLKSRVNNSGVG